MSKQTTRRYFLQQTAAGVAGAAALELASIGPAQRE